MVVEFSIRKSWTFPWEREHRGSYFVCTDPDAAKQHSQMRGTLSYGLLLTASVLASYPAVQRVEKTFEYLPNRFTKKEVVPDYFQQYQQSNSEERGVRRKKNGVYYGCVNRDDVALTFDDGIRY